jgi:hypothetical protein
VNGADPDAAGHPDGFLIRPYRRGDEDAILAGFARAFPGRRPLERWQAIYDAAPDGARIMLGLAAPGEVAAHYAATAHRGIRAGAEGLIGHVRDVFSVPRYRGLRGGRQGVFVRTGRAFYDTWGRDFCFLYGFPSPRSFRVGQILMGYRPFSRWLALRLPLAGQPSAAGTGGIVSPVTAFDQRFDDLWRRRQARIPLGVARDARFLEWRFGGIRDRLYWAWTFATYLEPGIIGYVVVRPQGDTALLVDCCLPDDPRLVASFWRQVAERLTSRGMRAVETWLSPSAPDVGALLGLGFREVATRPDIVPCFITFRPDLSPAWIDDHFCFGMADSDLD